MDCYTSAWASAYVHTYVFDYVLYSKTLNSKKLWQIGIQNLFGGEKIGGLSTYFYQGNQGKEEAG